MACLPATTDIKLSTLGSCGGGGDGGGGGGGGVVLAARNGRAYVWVSVRMGYRYSAKLIANQKYCAFIETKTGIQIYFIFSPPPHPP